MARTRVPIRAKTDAQPLAGALGAIGDPWSFLIVQEVFFGVRRFEEFQRNLGISRKTLADRLARLGRQGVLSKQAYQSGPPRYEYRLTPPSLDSYSYALCLMRWGDQWLSGKEGPPVTLWHQRCRKTLRPVAVCAACRREIRAEDVAISLGTATLPLAEPGARLRYSPRPALYTAGRPSSVSGAVAMIGDRWGFFVLWLALAGITKFEHFQRILGIARTMLTARLERLVEDGLLERSLYRERPPRYDYHLSAKGRALCPALLAMFDWGVRWRGAADAHLQVLHKACGKHLRVEVICSQCRKPPKPQEVTVAGSRRAAARA